MSSQPQDIISYEQTAQTQTMEETLVLVSTGHAAKEKPTPMLIAHN